MRSIASVAKGGSQASRWTNLCQCADRTYAVRIRRGDATSLVASLSAEPGEATAFVLLVPLPAADAFAAGDLAMVGEAERETAPLVVKAIVPGPDLTAKLVLVDAAPAINDADQGAIPAFDPLLTQPYDPPRRTPGEPVVLEIFSGNAALLRAGDGSILSRVGARLRGAPELERSPRDSGAKPA